MSLEGAAKNTQLQKVEFKILHQEVQKLETAPSELKARVSELKSTISSTGEGLAAAIEGKLNKTQQGIMDRTKEQQKVLLKMVNKDIGKDLEALGHEVRDLNRTSDISNRKITSMSAKVAKFSEKTEPSGYLKVAIKGTREERAVKYQEKIARLDKKVEVKKVKVEERMERLNANIDRVSNKQMELGRATNDRLRTENALRKQINHVDGQVKENKAQFSGKDKLTQDALKEKNTSLESNLTQLKSLDKEVKNKPIVLENEASFKTARDTQLDKTVKEAKKLQDNMDLVMSIRPKQDTRPFNIFKRIFFMLFGKTPESKISTDKYDSETTKLKEKLNKGKITQEDFDIKKTALDEKHMKVGDFQLELENLQKKIADYAQEIKGRGEGGKKYSYIGDTMGEVEKKFNELEKFAEKNNGEYSKLFEENKENLRYAIDYFNTPSFLKDPVNQSSQYLKMADKNLKEVGWEPKPSPKNVTIREDLNIETRLEKQEPVVEEESVEEESVVVEESVEEEEPVVVEEPEIAPEKSSNKPYVFNRDEFLGLVREYSSSSDGEAVKSVWASLLEFQKAVDKDQSNKDTLDILIMNLKIEDKIKNLEEVLKGENKDNFINGLKYLSNGLFKKI